MNEIQVGLGTRAYPILIEEGLLARVGEDLKGRNIAKRFGVIADSRVAGLYAGALLQTLEDCGIRAELFTFPAGEASKNLETIGDLASSLAARGFERGDGLMALGGGVTGDITGFLAAVYMRGIPFVQVPTSLLAQVDSSVGGKTGVDIPEGKNLVGVFYQPRVVYIDSRVLVSLPDDELLNGLAEVIKYGVIRDREFFDFLAERRTAILARELSVLEEIILKCCTIKAQVVEADEKEADLRRILNFGHTLGHAVEAASDFALPHGSAVAIGMVAAGNIAVDKGLFARQEADRLQELVASYGLPTAVPTDLDRDAVKGFLSTDKKAVGGRPFFVLPTAIGTVIITDEVSGENIDRVI